MRRYPATLVRHIDGDTFEFDVDQGFYVQSRQKVRLVAHAGGVDAPERGKGVATLRRVEVLLPVGNKCILHTFKDNGRDDADGAFGRWLALVLLQPNGESLGDMLLAEGLVTPWVKKPAR